MPSCTLCPRNCGVDRQNKLGFCGVSDTLTLSRAALHHWEEPCISGKGGSGAIFFSGCSLGCVFCQNHIISRGKTGTTVKIERMREICFSLKEQGAENINLVTPLHFTPQLLDAILPIKKELVLPIVCNTGGYDKVETLEIAEELFDCYLPDFKFADPDLAARYAHAENYPAVASKAIGEMVRQKGGPKLDARGMLRSGVVVRHLILPGSRKDSIRVLDTLHDLVGSENILLSLMSQYTPQPGALPPLSRKVTEFEYKSVLEHALKLGFKGYMQDRTSASSDFTPAFDGTGI